MHKIHIINFINFVQYYSFSQYYSLATQTQNVFSHNSATWWCSVCQSGTLDGGVLLACSSKQGTEWSVSERFPWVVITRASERTGEMLIALSSGLSARTERAQMDPAWSAVTMCRPPR